jgi:hypothetical protein
MNMPAADDHDHTPATGRPPILYIAGGIVALVAVMVILHLTGVVG